MKIKLSLILFAVFLFSTDALSQGVVITGKKITYTRKNPISDYWKTFTINYPKVKARNPVVSRRIEAVLSYEKIFDFKLRDEVGKTQWLENATYDVKYNANGILSLSLTIEGVGAYPWSSTRYVVVNTLNGTRVRPIDVFINSRSLLKKLAKMKDAEVVKTKRNFKEDPEKKEKDLTILFRNADIYNKLTLNEFEIGEKGVIFHYDYGFPHVVQAWQPNGEFFLTWKELKAFLKRDGPLAASAR